ncbi:MAG: hypothetical protein BWX71_02232 [Deltaproteobacteria bacterium ADurb.Bin072]|nr:MAG: hypothetical protein BWX71_02232 [Deltaproteobacteria bacterium ADurb.Bin072]
MRAVSIFFFSVRSTTMAEIPNISPASSCRAFMVTLTSSVSPALVFHFVSCSLTGPEDFTPESMFRASVTASSGTTMDRSLPRASSSGHPNMALAPLFQERIVPAVSSPMRASTLKCSMLDRSCSRFFLAMSSLMSLATHTVSGLPLSPILTRSAR